LRRARVAVAQAMRGRPTNTGRFDALPTTKRHCTGVFWASGAKK
jgi:hypothetical protein